MGYLVIKNGNTKKSYLCTNTCNKPRVKVSNSYIPLTGNVKNGMKCKITNKNIAEYSSYTYTGNQGTITTGTSYLTRSSTSGTKYNTTTGGSTSYSFNGINCGSYSDYIWFSTAYTTFPNAGIFTVSVYTPGRGETTTYQAVGSSNNYPLVSRAHQYGEYFSSFMLSALNTYTAFSYNSFIITCFVKGSYSIYRSTTCTTTYIYETIYLTRASTSNTLYGTKTTNKTLTSSSWG